MVGWPVRHSRSPLIHGYWIEQYKLDADYRREAIAPEAFADFISHLAERGYVGANITIPHKEAALAMSEPDDRAQAVGAANTLWYDRGRLLSTNTDVEGFTANLDACVPGWGKRAGEAVVLGAGGSARAIIYGLIERGIGKINVVNRTPERAQALQALFGTVVQPVHGAALPHLFSRTGLLVNTTSLGMTGQPPLAIDPPMHGELATVGRKHAGVFGTRIISQPLRQTAIHALPIYIGIPGSVAVVHKPLSVEGDAGNLDEVSA